MNNTKTSFTKSLRRFHNQHRRGIRLLRERTIGSFRALFMTLSLIGVTVGAPGAALAKTLPTGAQVVSGDIQLQQGGSALRVIQGSQAAIVNWQSFDIGHGALVDIVQPNVDAALLSRVVGENLSRIHGSLNANGHLYLINPNGILFGADSQVNVHALIASTLDLADSDFLSGNLAFDGNSEASVMNLGSINAEEFAALIGGDLENAGALTVSGGSAALLAGDATLEIGEAGGGKITLDLSGLIDGSSANSGIIDVSSDSGDGGQATILGGSVAASGSIDASGLNGGEVLIGGDYQGQNPNLSHAQNTVVSGSIEANAKTDGDGGKVIVWSDGSTDFSGSITAQGGDDSGNGGMVETSGKQIVLNGSVNTLAKSGLSGTYLIDPDDIEINTSSTKGGYSLITPSTILTNLGGGNVVVSTATEVGDGVTTDGGDIEIKADITATTTNSLTLTATDQIRSDYGTAITLSGGGDLILNAGVGGIQTIGTVSAEDVTTNSDGNQVFVGNLVVGGTFDFTASESGSVINVTNLSGGGTLNGSTNNGSVTIAANTGDLAIQSVDAGTGNLSLTSAAGAITDADTSSDTSANLIAAQITLESANGIGASGSGDLDTTASTLVSSVTGSGNIFITDSAAVSVGATSTGSGDITIGTSDGILTVSGTVNSSSGNLALTGDDGVTHTATGDLSTGGSGTVTVVASAGDVTMVDGTTYTAAGGTVSVTGASNVALGQIVNASGASNVTATAGSITDVTSAEDSGNENISGTTLTLSSATGIGSAGAANDLDVAATTIVASDLGTGSIYLAETDGVAIGATSTTSGALSIVAGGAVTTSGNISASGGSLALTGVGLTNSNTITGDANGISLSAGTGTLTSTAGSITNGGSAGTISLAADTDIVLAGGAGSITAGAGDVTLKDSAGSITMALAGGSGTIAIADADLDEITTTGTIIVGDASSGAVTIGGAVSAPGSAGLQFGGSSVALDAGVTSTDASITFVPGVTVGAGVTVDSGSGAGDITFSSTLDGGQAVVLDAGSGGINLNGVVGATPLTSLATTGTTGAISIGQNITTTGGQTFTGPVTLSGSPTLTTTDTLVSFDGDVSGAGALTVASGTGGVTFGSTVGNGVNITSLDTTGTTGNITLTGNLDSDGTVLFNGPVLLAADATITTSDDLVTFSSTLNNAQNLVVTTGSGGVTFTGIVGGSTPLTSILTTGTTGTITLGANVNTTGAQNYVGAVSFNSDIALNVSGGTDSDDVSFGDTVTSTADSLDINVAGSGDVTFGDGSGTDIVSGINALTVDGNAITVNTSVSATSIVFQGANSSGDQLTIASGGSLSATGLVTIGAAHDTTEIETISLSGNITSDSDSSGNENLQILSNSAGSAVATFATSGVILNAGTGAISASNTDFAAGSNNPSFLSDGGLSWNALTATGGTLTLAPNTANTGLNLGTGGGAYNLNDATLSGISNNLTKVTVGSSNTGDITIGGGEAIDLTDGTPRTWDLEVIGGANDGSASFVLGSANTVTMGSSQALILNSAAADITQTNQLLGGGELLVKGAGNVTLTNASNQVATLAASNSGDLSYRDSDGFAIGLVDGVSGINVGSNTVNLTLGGALTDGDADASGGDTTVNVTADTLNLLGNQAVTDIETTVATLDLTTAATSITETDGIALADSTVSGQLDLVTGGATSIGALTATSQTVNLTLGGALTDGDADASGGDTTVNVTADTLNLLGNQAVTDIETTVATLDLATAATSITETDGIALAASEISGALTLVASGAVTQSGAIDADSTASVTAGANAITLTNAGNDFTGAVSLSNSGSNDVALTDANALDLGTVGVGQNLTVTTGGALSDTGVITVAGTTTLDNSGGTDAAIQLDSASTYTGNVTFTTDAGSDVTITDNSAFAIQSGLNVNNLSIIATGAVTDLGDIDVDGTLTVSATGQTIDLSGGGSNDVTGAVTLTGAAVTLADTTATSIAGITATGALTLTSGGAITQSGVLQVTGDSTFANTAGTNAAITLGDSNNAFNGKVTFDTDAGSAVTITDATSLELETLSAASLNVTSGGAVTDGGTLAITGATSISASGQSITLDDTASTFGSLSLTGADVAVIEADATELGTSAVSGTLAITSGGAVTDSGALTIAGATTISANGQNITLDDTASTFGSLTLTGADVAITEADATQLGSSSVTGSLSITSSGEVTDAGTLTVGGVTTISASGQNITLDDASSTFGSLSLTGENVAVTENADMELAASTISGTATFNSSGNAVSDSGTLTIGGTTTINAGTATLTLDDSSSSFADLKITGGDVYVEESGSLTASSVSATNLQLKADSGISVTSQGVENFAAQSQTGDISIVNEGGNGISTMSSLNGVSLTDESATGTISIIAKSPLTINAPINAQKGSLLLAASGNSASDDLTINSEITAASAKIYAGDSIKLETNAILNTESTELLVGTNYDSTTQIASAGSESAKFELVRGVALPANTKISGLGQAAIGFDSKARVTQASYAQMVDYFNAIESLVEETVTWDNIELLGFLPDHLSSLLAPQNTGEIETEEE